MTKLQESFALDTGRDWRRAMRITAVLAGALTFAPVALSQDLSSFAILAGSEISNTGPTEITGNIGLHPGTDYTSTGITLTGSAFITDAVAMRAKSDLTSAYNMLMALSPTQTITDGVLTGKTLVGGVYSIPAGADLSGTLTLEGDADDIFVFQIGSTLTTAAGTLVDFSSVQLNDVDAKNVFFVVGSSATLGTFTQFAGQIYAEASITLQTNASINCGAALTQTAAVTLDTNVINVCSFTTSPEEIEDILGDDITDNGGSIVDAIADFVEGGGTLPLPFQLLALLSPTELAEALEQMSGELGTEVPPAGQQGMDSFLDLIGGYHGDSRPLLTSYDQPQAGGTVSVMGYMPASAPSSDAFNRFDASTQPQRDGEWTTWISGYGSQARTEGDAGTGSHDTTSSAYGVALGFERDVGPNTMVGVAVSTGGTSFGLEDDLGSGKSAMVQAALYARTSFENAYVAAAVAAGYHRVSLDRTLTFAGTDHFSAEFDATNIAGEIEAGYSFGWFTPFVALRGQAFSTPAYSEVTESGASTFALDYDANVATSLRTEIGARGDWSTDLEDGGTVNLYASAAWAHEIRDGDDMTASFQLVPGSPFVVSGAKRSADSLVAAAGAELVTEGGVALGTSVQGQFSGNAMTYGATARLSYSW